MQILRNDWSVSKWQAIMSPSLSHNFLGARTARSEGRILCGPPLVTLSTSFTLSFSLFVSLALATERYHTHFNRCFSCCDGYLVGQKTCCVGQKWDRPVNILVADLGFSFHLCSEYRMIFPVTDAAGTWVWPPSESRPTVKMHISGPICFRTRCLDVRSSLIMKRVHYPRFRLVKKHLDSVFQPILI